MRRKPAWNRQRISLRLNPVCTERTGSVTLRTHRLARVREGKGIGSGTALLKRGDRRPTVTTVRSAALTEPPPRDCGEILGPLLQTLTRGGARRPQLGHPDVTCDDAQHTMCQWSVTLLNRMFNKVVLNYSALSLFENLARMQQITGFKSTATDN